MSDGNFSGELPLLNNFSILSYSRKQFMTRKILAGILLAVGDNHKKGSL
jgi:hypothetical protein